MNEEDKIIANAEERNISSFFITNVIIVNNMIGTTTSFKCSQTLSFIGANNPINRLLLDTSYAK